MFGLAGDGGWLYLRSASPTWLTKLSKQISKVKSHLITVLVRAFTFCLQFENDLMRFFCFSISLKHGRYMQPGCQVRKQRHRFLGNLPEVMQLCSCSYIPVQFWTFFSPVSFKNKYIHLCINGRFVVERPVSEIILLPTLFTPFSLRMDHLPTCKLDRA